LPFGEADNKQDTGTVSSPEYHHFTIQFCLCWKSERQQWAVCAEIKQNNRASGCPNRDILLDMRNRFLQLLSIAKISREIRG
jgi:hypothetical protein